MIIWTLVYFQFELRKKSYKKLGDWQYINNELRDYVAFFWLRRPPRLRCFLSADAFQNKAFKEGMFAKFEIIPDPTESSFLSLNFLKANDII